MSRQLPARIGLVAGWGRFPIIIAEELRRRGAEVHCQGVLGHADPCLADLCETFRWAGLGKIGRAIRHFKRNRIEEVTLAGKIHKVFMFQPRFILRHLPDWKTFWAFAPNYATKKKDCKDDTLLGVVVNMFAADGLRLASATDYVPELLVKRGQLTRRGPSKSQFRDVVFGWKIAKELGRLDCGQSVVVKNQAVLALEAVEGTDACIQRAGELCPAGGFTVVKTAKPRQDMRFDVPTIGLDTVQTIHASGGRILAVEAERTIILDESDVIEFANQHNLIVIACKDLDGVPTLSWSP